LGKVDIDFAAILPANVTALLASKNITSKKINDIVGKISRLVNLTEIAGDAFDSLTGGQTKYALQGRLESAHTSQSLLWGQRTCH
jgi:hypothetical protein